MKELIILGTGNGWQDAPRNTAETWGITKIIFWRQDIDMLFDMHDLDSPNRVISKEGALIAGRNGVPVMSIKDYDWMPDFNNGWGYPLAVIKQEFGTDYFANTLCYAIALAIWSGTYKKIDLYGVNMTGEVKEHLQERPCIEHWLGIAKGRGIEVIVHGDSDVLKTYNRKLYGYNTDMNIEKQTNSGLLNLNNKEDLCRNSLVQ